MSPHYATKATKDYEDRLKEAGNRLQKTGFRAFAFIQHSFDKGYHPEAILETIEYMAGNHVDQIRNKWAYANHLVKVKSGNYYERDNRGKADKDKADFGAIVAGLKQLLGR